MVFSMVLLGAVVGSLVLRNPLKRFPMLFYGLAIAIDVLFAAGSFGVLPREVWMPLFVLVQKCTLALALFVVVMYIGVAARGSRVRQWLQPVRAELSIVAWILSLGHMSVYLVSYAPRLGAEGMSGNIVGSFALALVLLVLLLVLGVTSFNAVKRRMRTEQWKRVQRLSYLFFALVYVHLMLMLAPSAMRGGEAALVSVAVYTVVFGAYAGLRVRRALLDRVEQQGLAGTVEHADVGEPQMA